MRRKKNSEENRDGGRILQRLVRERALNDKKGKTSFALSDLRAD